MSIRSWGLRWGVLAAGIAMVAACGGGGGGGGDSGDSASGLTVSADKLFFGAPVGGASNQQSITGTINDASGTVYVYILYTNYGIAGVTYPVYSGTSATSYVIPKSSLAKGVYFDTVTVKACSDYACNNQLPGSPKIVPVTYVVGMATVPALLSFSAAAGVAPTPQTVTVYDYEQASNWSSSPVETTGTGWLNYSPADGSTSPQQVTVSPSAMAAGSYSGEISFSSHSGTQQVTLPITYTSN